MLQSTEPFERHRISVATKQTEPTALSTSGCRTTLKDQTQQPLHVDALGPYRGPDCKRALRGVRGDPELFWDGVELSNNGLPRANRGGGAEREADKQAIYLKAAFPSVPTRHAGQPLYQAQQLQSWVSVPSAAATLLPVLEPPSDVSLAKMLATPPPPPAAEAAPE